MCIRDSLGAESTDAPRASERPSSASSGKKSPVADPAAPREVRVHGPAGVTISHSSNGACVVERVVRGNGFHAAGVRAGDVVVAVNGTAVRDHETAICFIEQRCRAGDCVISYKPCTNLAVQLLHGTRSTLEPALSSLRRGLASAHASARRLSRPSPLATASTGRVSPSEAGLIAS